MANSCNNEIRIAYLNEDKVNLKKANKMLDEFEKEFSYDMFEINWRSDDNDVFEISMTSKWAAPNEEKLQNFASKHKVSIIGVSWEFSNGYVESFNILP